MTPFAGTYELGPDTATLTVRTGKRGAAAKAGHNLEIKVGSWQATLTLAADDGESTLALTADSRTLRVLEGSGGVQALGDEEKASIEQSIDDDVLKGGAIAFQSTHIHPEGAEGALHVHGDLNLLGTTRPLEFSLQLGADGKLTGHATVVQTEFGIKPFSALFGTLKVADEVQIDVDGRLTA